ncbi:hypothetical protein CJ010_22465 [Azoarcus sp. DD4]|uniref:EF-hand domain-containing protein n=1 Tax=Azoarcus sp. DD4 TaxID=2027405 RepID=UPI0011295189|nr:EF-hand domain-containing protein [Azoarcus sp. DD4]QDF99106.1 hypothetical protein CJ010_22465 [Azoarcus sp. DD4]
MKTTRRVRALAIHALLALLAPAQAGAADAAQSTRMLEVLRERFAKADADRDGALSEAEAKAGMPYVHRNFAEIDGVGSGRVTLAQIEAFAARKAASRQR